MNGVEAYVWWCGDEVCDCTQAHIDHIQPNRDHLGFITRTTVWEGTFQSGGPWEGEMDAYQELEVATGALQALWPDIEFV